MKKKDVIVIYSSQRKADEAFRRTVDVFGKESLGERDPVRRKITLHDGNTVRFISENGLCHKLASLVHDDAALLDCWRWDKSLDKHEKLKSKLKESKNNVA